MSGFIILGILLTVAAVVVVVLPLLRETADGTSPVAATIMAVSIPAAVMLLYATVGNYGWDSGAQTPPPAREQAMAPDLADALAGLEARLAAQPNDLDGWLLLGNSYLQLQRFEDAREAFVRAMTLSDGKDPAAKLGLVETEVLLDRSALAGPAGELIEEVLVLEPDNPKALWYGGLAALARGDTASVQRRWGRLLTLSPPDRVRTVIEDQLAALAEPDSGGTTPPPPTPATASSSIEVTVSIAEALAPKIAAGAALFLVARDANAGGPPVAVVRQSATELPVTLRISDANVMVAGRSLTDLDQIRLIARVANGGDPLAKPGDIFGETVLTSPVANIAPVSIVMDQIVQP